MQDSDARIQASAATFRFLALITSPWAFAVCCMTENSVATIEKSLEYMNGRKQRKSSPTIHAKLSTNSETRSRTRWGRRCMYPEGCAALAKEVLYGDRRVGSLPQFCKSHRGKYQVH